MSSSAVRSRSSLARQSRWPVTRLEAGPAIVSRSSQRPHRRGGSMAGSRRVAGAVRSTAGAVLAAASVLLIAPRLAQAQDSTAQEVLRYTLTDGGLARYSQATKQLAALPDQGSDACDDEGTEAQSLDDMAAKLDAVPGASAAIRSAGMTSREYVLFSLSLLQNGLAAWAVSQPGGKLPPGVSRTNVDFMKKHDAELKQLEPLRKKGDCDDEGAEDDAAEDVAAQDDRTEDLATGRATDE